MKKSIVLLGILIGLLITQPAHASAPEVSESVKHSMPASLIDNVEVPYEVLEYAQMKYQGFAVTQVVKNYRNNESVYVLRVDNDDIPNDFHSINLIYSANWKLLGEEKMTAPVWQTVIHDNKHLSKEHKTIKAEKIKNDSSSKREENNNSTPSDKQRDDTRNESLDENVDQIQPETVPENNNYRNRTPRQ